MVFTIIIAIVISGLITLGLDYFLWWREKRKEVEESWQQLNEKLEKEGKKRLDGKKVR